MTDKKEIIIDGVDVSGCEYYDQGICNIPDVIETYDILDIINKAKDGK